MSIQIRRGNPGSSAVSKTWLRQQCLLGKLPAEMLTTEDREHVVHILWKRGWTDAEIASHTFTSTYTTARIRSRLKLAPHRPVEGAA